jgi:lysozyme family protein
MRYADKWPKYRDEWDRMVINQSRLHEFTGYAQFAIDHKTTYVECATATGVPWEMLAVIHRREGNSNFTTYLGNGQSLLYRTTIVPIGRGPFTGPNAFVNGAVDAVKQEGWSNIQDWRLEKMLYYCELFNGVGYEMHGIPSPYLWGGTNVQVPGKYISDHVFNYHVMDSQPGCAPMLQQIAKLDPTVQFVRES